MKMFKHILVPTDLTDHSLHALEVAARIASLSTCRVTLLHVIETIEDTEGDLFEEFYRKLERRAERKMDRMLELFESDTFSILREIVFGKRVREIVQYAHRREIDLIILSSHTISMEETSQGWGTISYKVGILSHCPVMLVKK
ncbi:MAG: universal stress protein [Syntrophobacteraceae bacterium]|jgi:nucleotide-binding universal stress UspA family protein|nr:universal stress protein [Syntrophobacteraceae bacterium]